MLSERSMVKIRWLALGSALAFFAIMDVRQIRGLLLLVAAGVLYNLLLASVKLPEYSEFLKTLSTIVDITGLTLLIVFTGGPNSIFVLYMAIYLFSVALRHSVTIGLALAVLASAGLSVYYFSSPSAEIQAAVLTRVVVFMIAPLGALLLDARHGGETHVQITEAAEKPSLPEPEPEIEAEPEPESTPEPEPVEAAAPPVPEPAPQEEKLAAVTSAPIREEVATPAEETVLPEKQTVADKPAAADKTPAAGTLAEQIGVASEPEETVSVPASEPPTSVLDTRMLREKISELSTLHEASKALGASLILEEIVDTVVDISAKGLHGDIAGALVYDDKTGLMTVAGLRGFTSEEREVINSTTFTPGEGILGEVFLKKKTLNIVDLSEERPGSAPFNGRVRSFLVTPLSTDGYDIGVLFLGKFVKEPFSASAEEFIETISGQAAIAVENARLYTQAQELAIHNGLTGIYNYRYFMKQLDEEIKRAERYGRSVSLMMIDIDLFKNVNDSHGHQRGDEVLKGLAQTLVNNTRETDVVARYGGEEFCVILPETDLEDALEVAEKLRTSVAKASYARERGHSVKITISIGVAAYPGNAGNQEDLLRKSDDALYAAKTKRNMVVSASSAARSSDRPAI
ncbi:MAG: sensor domain-containing diguanylate cyclase [Actinomycetota bacterium]